MRLRIAPWFGRLVPQRLQKHGFRGRLFSALAGPLFGLAVWVVLEPALGLSEPQNLAWNLPAPHSAKSEPETIPAGTTIFTRLENSVSTASSHLHSPVSARVVRDVTGPDGVLIPVGSSLDGEIETLIPSSSPTDRAKLLLKFTSLEIPGQKPAELAAHLIEIENAREKVLPTGAIQGLLQSELPVSLLQAALEKWKKANPQMGQEAQKQQLKYLGKTSTAISYDAGTDLNVSLDKPLALGEIYSPAVPGQISAGARLSATELLRSAPQRDSSKDGKPGDPLNLLIIGNQSQIQQVFAAAGWDIPQRGNSSALMATVRAAVTEQGYGKAPISDLYLYGQRENLAFEKMLNTFTKRHHLRLWRSPAKTADGHEIWLGAATHDNGIDIHPGVVSHAIDPDLDLERAKVGADLILSGQVAAEEHVSRPSPLTKGLTATGASWKTDGQLLAIELKP
jgi:LssY-like putative type I secretion system component LssY